MLEKSILVKLNEIELENPESQLGFRKGKSTHDAFRELSTYLKSNNKPCTFIDMCKGYNTIDRTKLFILLDKKVQDKLVLRLIKTVMTNYNTKILETYVSTGQGVPQGSCLSAWLFSICQDAAVTEAKSKVVGLERVIMFADDMVCCGDFELEQFVEILKTYGFKINLKKSASFRKKQKGIPKRKTYVYLGTKLNDRGLAIGQGKIVAEMKKKSKSIGKLGRNNPRKGLLMLMSLCGGMTRFHTERHVLRLNPGLLVKNVLKLHKALNNHMACSLALAILKKKPDKANLYAFKIINLTKLNGVKNIN